ncbi:hypothetical protein [Clostridium tertium]|uniref:hypothetical protein n=1 Tax=Clostridium tertium TaxID=1559 RepID=UPI002A81BF06|nr:hypothetical protein [Clostridium tertium]MDY4605254.1 hypothetical protein [Clostridium tertium]
MFIRKKTLLNMIEVLKGEVVNFKQKVSELEALNNTRKINFNIGGKEIGRITTEKICLASTEPIGSFDSNGLTIKGEININGYKEEKQC